MIGCVPADLGRLGCYPATCRGSRPETDPRCQTLGRNTAQTTLPERNGKKDMLNGVKHVTQSSLREWSERLETKA